jgi:DNA-binding MarR family transcriptional regulator
VKSKTPLQRELKQRRPFQSAAHECVVALLRTTDLIKRRTALVVEPQGITLQQFNVLRILRGGGNEGLPTLEVAERMIEQTPGVTRLLDRLEAKGLVRRQRCPKDRRQHLCWITQQGGDVLATLDGPVAKSGEDNMKGLETGEQAALLGLLAAIRAAHQ